MHQKITILSFVFGFLLSLPHKCVTSNCETEYFNSNGEVISQLKEECISKTSTDWYSEYLANKTFETGIDWLVRRIYGRYSNLADDCIKIYRIVALEDFAGGSYLLYEFGETGCAVFDFNSFDTVELSCVAQSPAYGKNGIVRFVPMSGYYEQENNTFVNIHTQKTLSDDGVAYLREKSLSVQKAARDCFKYDNFALVENFGSSAELKVEKKNQGPGFGTDGGIWHTADHEIEHSWYFKRNEWQFASNHSFHTSGDCGYVALGLLFVYHELFSSLGYFSESESLRFIEHDINSDPNLEIEVPVVQDTLIGELVRKVNTPNQTAGNLERIACAFLENKAMVCEPNHKVIYSFNNIKRQIDNNNPVVLCGDLNMDASGNNTGGRDFHDVVIYGYYDDDHRKFLTHYGWANCAQVVLTDYTLSQIFTLEHQDTHTHNRYYLHNGHHYCACGFELYG